VVENQGKTHHTWQTYKINLIRHIYQGMVTGLTWRSTERQATVFTSDTNLYGKTPRPVGIMVRVPTVITGFRDVYIREIIGRKVMIMGRLCVPSLTDPPRDGITQGSSVVTAQVGHLTRCQEDNMKIVFEKILTSNVCLSLTMSAVSG
jgi:hypothetical protein